MSDLYVRFWGVRGSTPCADPTLSRYGGNTSCVEVRCGKQVVIFDCGTGLRGLGKTLVQNGAVEADIFFSHFHIDHIIGLPFFAPCHAETSRLRLWAGNLLPDYRIDSTLRRMISEPLFPTGLESFKASIKFHDFRPGDVLTPFPGVTLRTAPLNHPGRSTGYRLEYDKHVIAYITDTEHRPGQLDPNVLWLANGADLMICDCNYTEDEFDAHVGWGHSTWQEGVRLADQAGAKKLAIFHHDPDHDDNFLDRLAAEAAAARPGTIVAAEGVTVRF